MLNVAVRCIVGNIEPGYWLCQNQVVCPATFWGARDAAGLAAVLPPALLLLARLLLLFFVGNIGVVS